MCDGNCVINNHECKCNKFSSEELRELLLNEECKNDTKVVEIINKYDEGEINLDEAIAEILVSYFNCN
ncbi:hypothetical protein FJY84_06200 [Candidatus Bathyarchaeota archaeon]|nr:hypothetical protein [Candidatus Bathyarchaeota archaeon]